MMYLNFKLFLHLIVLHKWSLCFWPPPYSIQLNQSEEFVISEVIESDDVEDIYDEEDEMLKLDKLKNQDDSEKYFKIHQLSEKRNKIEDKKYTFPNRVKFKEYNHDLEDPIPWQGGFVDKNGNFVQRNGDENVYYLNELAEDLIENKTKEKRENEPKSSDNEPSYDYSNFKAEYNEEVKVAMSSNNTLNFTEVKEDETAKESVKSLLNFKTTPRNCTEEENKGIGIGAAECLWLEINKPRLKNKKLHIVEKICRILIIWFLVYLFIAIPCWCQNGWCCCCFRCKYCKPQERIDEAKKFLAENPIGFYHDKKGKKFMYPPTEYEKYAQKKLQNAIMRI